MSDGISRREALTKVARGTVLLALGSTAGFLVRKADGQLAAFSQKCTHLSCAVYYSAERNRLECPCHEGYFSVEDGRVLQGPPPRPLPMIRVEERDGNIVATGVGAHGEGA